MRSASTGSAGPRTAIRPTISNAPSKRDGSESFLISIAVAGFAQAELEITQEDNQLLVRGQQKDDPSRQYLHRGIAARQFQRNFLLADGVEVKGAVLEHGMLVISVIRPKAAKLSRRIEIRSA